MNGRVNRRRAIALVIGAIGAIGATGAPAVGRAGDVSTQDYCYWRRAQGPLCSGGRKKEYWCEYCNDPGSGSSPTRCEWRDVGRC